MAASASVGALWLVVCVCPARADEDLGALLSEPLEATASKATGTAAAAPGLSINISAEDLQHHGIQTLAEAYNFLTMGLVSEDPLGEPEVGSRGLMFVSDQSKHVLLLLDGHITNDQESGASLHGQSLGLPMELVDHIEIVLGPGSVLYGSNAMLGVINVVTKRAKEQRGIHAFVLGSVAPPINRAHRIVGPTGSFDYVRDLGTEYRVGLTFGREFELRGRPAELTASLQYYALKGPAMEWGPQLNRGVSFGPRAPLGSWGGKTRDSFYAQVPSGYLRLLVGEWELSVHLVSSRVSQPYQRRQEQLLASYFDDPDGAKTRQAGAFDLRWDRNLTVVTAMMARLFVDVTTESSRAHDVPVFGCIRDEIATVPCLRTNSGFARSIGGELQARFDWAGTRKQVTMLGGEGRILRGGYQNGSTEVETGAGIVYSDFDSTDLIGALYLQHVYQPVRRFSANGGARWDFNSRFGNRLVPRAALVGEPWSGAFLKVIYSEAFRAPTLDEVNYRSPISTLQAQDLKPESVQSIEAVLQQRFGTQSLVFGVFRSRWRDMIIRRELTDIPGQMVDNGKSLIDAAKRAGQLSSIVQFAYQYQNVASIESFGFNGGYDGSLAAGRVAYALNLTASYARFSTPAGSRRVPLTPALFGNARLSLDLSERLPTLGVALHFSDRRLAEGGEDAGFQPLPFAPPAFHLRGTLSGRSSHVKGLVYRLIGNYAFDDSSPYTAGPSSFSVRYQPAPELVPSVRLSLMATAELTFGSGR